MKRLGLLLAVVMLLSACAGKPMTEKYAPADVVLKKISVDTTFTYGRIVRLETDGKTEFFAVREGNEVSVNLDNALASPEVLRFAAQDEVILGTSVAAAGTHVSFSLTVKEGLPVFFQHYPDLLIITIGTAPGSEPSWKEETPEETPPPVPHGSIPGKAGAAEKAEIVSPNEVRLPLDGVARYEQTEIDPHLLAIDLFGITADKQEFSPGGDIVSMSVNPISGEPGGRVRLLVRHRTPIYSGFSADAPGRFIISSAPIARPVTYLIDVSGQEGRGGDVVLFTFSRPVGVVQSVSGRQIVLGLSLPVVGAEGLSGVQVGSVMIPPLGGQAFQRISITAPPSTHARVIKQGSILAIGFIRN